MAKRQQTGEFNPTRAIQPAQQITDQYISPSYFQMPQNEAIDIARSLSGLSQSLNSVMGKQVEADTAEQVAQAGQAVAGMSKEELEATIGQQWRAAGLPEGADPVSQIALLEHAGKRLAKDALQKFRTENMDRFSDPMNTEDPREAMLAEFESLGISGFYASNAATEVYTNEANAFSEQVYQARAAGTAKQNRANLENDLFELMAPFMSGENWTDQSTEEMLVNMQGALDEAYQKFGFSGRDQLMNAITQAVQTLAKDDLTTATNLLVEVARMKVGGQTVGKQFAFELDQLQDKAEDIRKAEIAELGQLVAMQKRADQDLSGPIIDEYIASQLQSGDLKLDQIDNDLRSKLEEAGVKNVNEAILEARKEAKTQLSLGNESDDETLIELDDIAASFAGGNPVMNQEQFKARISENKDKLSASDYRRYNQLANAFGNVETAAKDNVRRNAPEINAYQEIIGERLGELALVSGGENEQGAAGSLTSEASSRISDALLEHRRDMEQIVKQEAARGINLSLTQDQIDTNTRESLRKYRDEVVESLSEGLPADSELRMGQQDPTAVTPLVLSIPETAAFTNDSVFAGVVQAHRDILSGPAGERRQVAVQKIRTAGYMRLQELIGSSPATDRLNRKPFGIKGEYSVRDGEIVWVESRRLRGEEEFSEYDTEVSPTANKEYHALRAIGSDPYTPEELEAAKTNGNVDRRGVKIPPSVSDPKITLFFGTMDTLKNAAEEYEAAEDKSKTYIGRLLEHTPKANFDSFLFSQAALLGYRGTN